MEITFCLRLAALATLVAAFFFLLREQKLISCEWLRGQLRHSFLGLALLVSMAVCMIHTAATKTTNGLYGIGSPRLVSFILPPSSVNFPPPGPADGYDFAPHTNAVTNLTITGIGVETNAVYLRAAWPANANWTSDQLHVFASRDLRAELWEGVATLTMPSWTNWTSLCLPFGNVLGGRYGSMFFRLGLGGDTDGDGIDDVVELRVAGTDPALADTDGDGLSDGWEWEHRQDGVDPLLYDSDDDGVNDGDEIASGTRPDRDDTDGDGLPDGEEAAWIEEGAEIPWFDVSSGTVLAQSQSVDSALYTVGLSTAVRLAGSRVTHLVVDVNGIVYFGDSSVTGCVESSDWAIDASFDLGVGMVTVAACSEDLRLDPSRNSAITFAEVAHDGVTYAVVEFSRVGSYYGDWGDEVSFQVSMPLDSAADVVHVRYGNMSVSQGCQIGIGAQGARGYPALPYWYDYHLSVAAGDVVSFHFGSGSDPLLVDTDGDGLDDRVEVLEGTNPHDQDTDRDGLSDDWEAENELDPLSAEGDDGVGGDPDLDGLANRDEYAFGSDPRTSDTDMDGLSDLREAGGLVATNAVWLALSSVTNLTAAFNDVDGSVAVWELPSPVTVQGVCVSNVSIDVNGVVFFNRGGYCLTYGVGSGAMLVESWAICQDAFTVAPYWSDLVLSSTPPATMVTAGEAMVDGVLNYVIQYENASSYWGDGSVSWQLSFPAGKVWEMVVRYSGLAGTMDGRDASIGFQSFDGRRTCPWCYHEQGVVRNGKALALIVPVGTNPTLADTDCDGVNDFEEVQLGTNPIQPDTDGDGLTDGWELEHSAPTNSDWTVFDPLVHNGDDVDGRNDANADPDEDGLTNAEECMWGTSPWSVDTDGDGATDGEETGAVPRPDGGVGATSGDGGGGGGTPGFSDPADPSDGGVPGSRVKATFRFGDDSGSHSEKYRLDIRCVVGDGQSYGRVNLNYGVCEEQSVALKPGCAYEARLFHAGTDPQYHGYDYPDYDYLLELQNPLSLLLVDDPYGLFGVDYTSDFFAGEGKVATLSVPTLEFVTPAGNPVTAPRSSAGDGQNEFTYDDATSSLTMLLKVRVTPSLGVTAWSRGRFSLPAIPGATLEWENGSDGFADAVGGEFTARATYRGYPTHNSGFGRKTVHFTIDGRTISQNFEVFFPKFGINHPVCSICPNCSNWFYYWRDGEVCSIPENARWCEVIDGNSDVLGKYNQANGLIFVSDAASKVEGGEFSLPKVSFVITNVIYMVDHEYTSSNISVSATSQGISGHRYFLRSTQTLTDVRDSVLTLGGSRKGIACVAAVISHEQCHADIIGELSNQLTLFNACWNRRDVARLAYGSDSLEYAVADLALKQAKTGGSDDDEDHVFDGGEKIGYKGIVSRTEDPDTYGISQFFSSWTSYSPYGDDEVRARLQERVMSDDKYHVELDWSAPGCQHEDPYGP